MDQTTFSLFEAIEQFAANRREAMRHVVGHMQVQYPEIRKPDFDLDDHLVREADLILELRSSLVTGRLLAKGIPQGAFDPVQPSPEWWADARINLLQNTAMAHGTTLGAVVVWEAAALPRRVTGEATGVTPQQWMLDATQGGWVKRESLIKECMQQTKCTWRESVKAHAKLPANRRNKPGRRAKL